MKIVKNFHKISSFMSILRKFTQPKCLIYQKAQKDCSEDEPKSLEWPQNICLFFKPAFVQSVLSSNSFVMFLWQWVYYYYDDFVA